MKRILVVGPGGSGKSTVARILGEITGLPVIHLDLLYWNPGWIATPDDEFDAKIKRALSADRWICDGNYGRTFGMRLQHADAVVFLDLPRLVCLWRVLRRTGKPRPDLPPNCPERRFTHDYFMFLKWIWQYPKRYRTNIAPLLEEARDTKTIYALRTQRQIERFLNRLRIVPR